MPKEFEFVTLEGLQAFKEESEAQSNGAYASKLTITQDETTGVITLKLFASDNTLLDTKTLDLETEKIIKSVSLNYAQKKLVFTLSDDSTINCDISDLIDTLEDKIKAVEDDLDAEERRATGAENNLGNRITTIENDYLTESDKTELANDIVAEETRAKGVEKSIKDKIPTEASAQNQLADKEWVNRNGGKIDSVSIDGTPVEPDVNKNVDLPAYPTRVSLQINNVNNTSDADKPVSTLQREAIDASGHRIALEINSETYEIVAKLYDANDNLISTSNVIDLPLESVVVSGRYDAVTKDVVLTLEGGSVIRFSVADLIYGLQSEITANNPLSSDLVSDDNNAHKFVSANEKAQITTNKNDIAGIKNGAEINNFDDTEKALAKKQNTIDADHKLSATLISETTNKQFISSEDKAQINSNKQAIVDIKNGTSIESFDDVEKELAKKQTTIDSDHKLSANLIEENANKKFVSDAEKTTWNNKYDKPSGGIPKTDLSDDVKTSLGKADSAVQDANYVHTDNNYTNAEKQKLADLENYDDTEVRGLITTEANRATKQENKALHFKGAFDSDDGKTRQTWEVDLGSLEWSKDGDNRFYNRYGGNMEVAIGSNIANIKCSKYIGISEQDYTRRTQIGVSIAISNGIPTILIYDTNYNDVATFTASLQGVVLQYKLATPITTNDDVIAGESLLPLDANMANKLRQDVVDSLNILDFDIFNRKIFSTSGNTGSQFNFEVWADDQYQTNIATFRIHSDGSNPEDKYRTISNSGLYYCRIGINGNASDDKTAFKRVYIEAGAYTFSGIFTRLEVNAVIYKKLMLSKGFYEYQPTDYNANKHITNPHAEYLKKKWEDSINILDKSDIKMGGYDGSGTLMTNLNAGYFEAGTTLSYKYTKSFLHEVYLTSQPLPTSGENILQLIHSGIMYEDKEFTFTLTQSGYVGFLIGKNPVSDITIEEAKQIDLCLSYSKEPYDPQEYNPREHITNEEATLLKNEYKKCINLCKIVGQTSNNVVFKNLNGTYSLSFNIVNASGTSVLLYSSNEQRNIEFISSQVGYAEVHFTVANDNITIVVNGNTISNIMLNEGSIAKPYTEPYGPIVHTTDIEPVLLWENGSPNDGFTNQTINVNNISKFKFIVIGFKTDNGTEKPSQFIKVAYKLGGVFQYMTAINGITNIYTREGRFESNGNQVYFYNGYYNNGESQYSCIPVVIYGTNIL